MDMRDKWIAALRAWAANNDNVLELWLFGSRANGKPRVDSDIDVAVALMPPDGNTNWALGAFIDCFDDWKAELCRAVDWDVDLIAIGKNFDMDTIVRTTGIVLWRRESAG
jgi:predicted nucleotidyltransferase